MAHATGSFLDLTDQLLFFAFGELQIIVRQPRKSLFQFASGDIPVPYEFQYAHTICISLASKSKVSFATAVPRMSKRLSFEIQADFKAIRAEWICILQPKQCAGCTFGNVFAHANNNNNNFSRIHFGMGQALKMFKCNALRGQKNEETISTN